MLQRVKQLNIFSAYNSNKQTCITVLVLFTLAILIYAPLIGWGVPYANAPDRIKTYAVDEILPLEGLAEMHNTFIDSKPDRNYGYPWFHYFVVAVAQTPYIAYLKLSGELGTLSPEYPFGLLDPVRTLEVLTLIGRAVTVLMAAGVVVCAYYFSLILWGHLAGIIGALLTLLNYPMFYYSRTGNLDVPVFFWSSIGLVIFAKVLVAGLTTRRAVWLGIFAGIAMATKDQAVIIFLPFAFVLLFPGFNYSPDSSYQIKPLLMGLGASILAYIIATGVIVDPQRHITHVYRLFFEPERLSSIPAYWPSYPRTWAGLMDLTIGYFKGLVLMEALPVILTSIIGVYFCLKSSSRFLVLLIPIFSLFFMLTLLTNFVIYRYYLSLTIIIDAFAAYAIIVIYKSYFKPISILLIFILLGYRLLPGADLTYAQFCDSRDDASKWLITHVKPDEQIEYFGMSQKLPHLPVEIKTRRIAGRIKWKRELDHGPFVLRYLVQNGPEYLLIIPDATSRKGMDRSGDCPPEVYDALVKGRVPYAQAAFFPRRHLPFNPLRRPFLDNPSVCPPVRIFVRNDIIK